MALLGLSFWIRLLNMKSMSPMDAAWLPKLCPVELYGGCGAKRMVSVVDVMALGYDKGIQSSYR